MFLSSVDYSINEVELIANILSEDWQTYLIDYIKDRYYSSNSEWKLFAYSFDDEGYELTDELYQLDIPSNWSNNSLPDDHTLFDDVTYSSILYRFGFERNSPYFTMTLIVPILALTLLAPLGLILSG